MRPVSLLTEVPGDVVRTLRETTIAGLLFPLGYGSAVAGHVLPRLPHPPAVHRTPVVLVHGYGGNAATWRALERRLHGAGFTSHVMLYSPLARCVSEIARRLVAECHDAMRSAGTDSVHLVGHSLGGLVVRYAVQRLGLEPSVRTAVTVATPHRGTLAALLGRGRLVASLRPGSRMLEDLRRCARPGPVRWVSYYSDRDMVVRPYSSRLEERLGATNVLVPGVGHLGIVRAPAFLSSIVHLLGADSAGAPATAPHPAAAA